MVYTGPTAGTAVYNTISHSISADPKGAAKNFFNELSRLLSDYADPEKDLVWRGIRVPADQKYQALGAIVMGEARTTLSQQLEAPFAYFITPMMQAEKTIGDLISQS